MISILKPASSTDSNRLQSDQKDLCQWYKLVKRDLPWRKNRDAYKIWISEVMLQQTTVATVIPYYHRFIDRFPDIRALAQAKEKDVIENWAGLGYYSRARNLHKAAIQLHQKGFPNNHVELLALPGFGPYTARAVASIAFGEAVGVLDGNVIRVLSRKHGLFLEWWKPQARHLLQQIADQLTQVQGASPSDVNQGLMELGATICTPKSPACALCPWSKSCVALKEKLIEELPLKKPRPEREIWQWSPSVVVTKGKTLFVPNNYAPFLKGHWILPGTVRKLTKAPKTYDFKGVVTRFDIYVRLTSSTQKPIKASKAPQSKWLTPSELLSEVPSSLIRKALSLHQK